MIEQYTGVAGPRRDSTLAAQAQQVLEEDPYSGHMFVFRGRRGDLLKIIWWDQQGACLFSKRLERGRFVWTAICCWKGSGEPGPLTAGCIMRSGHKYAILIVAEGGHFCLACRFQLRI